MTTEPLGLGDLSGALIAAAARAQLLDGAVGLFQFGNDGPVGVVAMMGTERANDEPSATYEERRGRCYELAGYAVAFGQASVISGVKCVHGSWHGPNAEQRIGHAWVEVPTPAGLLIWEPINGVLFNADEFRKYTRAWDEVTYDLPTLRRALAAHGNYGRWHQSRYP